MSEFKEFPKIARLNREVVITEKIDGTNACIIVGNDGSVTAQSRSRIITPEDDNYGFAKWAKENSEELNQLGEGHHYGEWWGQGIQRNYGLTEKRFSLFNVKRWVESRPACCHVVPVIASQIGLDGINGYLQALASTGSRAAPGFMKPEGIVVFHAQGNILFKATIEKDDEYKGKSHAAP